MSDFEQIYQAYFRDVYFYVCKLTGDTGLAEDITSETFVKALQAIDGFQGKSSIRVWLCQIAKNCYLSRLRKDKRLVFTSETGEQVSEANLAELLVNKDSALDIYRILHGLDEPYKEVFYLRVFGELSFKQIASLFGKSDNWACVTYHRARKKILEQMGDEHETSL